ncbi:hypothetical protein [Staphylococcus marylandisciuri]|uniref:hypothetical protein n=1 Tax=Staphylococcus marylandisciuri TaxID=2981529 RepID=UPI0021CFA26D|nr:hypothetical protein [Staphylococcus marylandisciuri]
MSVSVVNPVIGTPLIGLSEFRNFMSQPQYNLFLNTFYNNVNFILLEHFLSCIKI